MCKRKPNRSQEVLIPELLSTRIERKPHPARFFYYIAISLELPFYQEKFMGATPFHRPTMVALILYAFFNHRFSIADIWEFAQNDLGAIWILDSMKLPSKKTFERVVNEVFENVTLIFYQVLRLCEALNLIGRERLFIDGKKSKANASKHKAMSYKRLCEKINKTEQQINTELEKIADVLEGFDDLSDEELRDLIYQESKKLYQEKKAEHKQQLHENQQSIYNGEQSNSLNPKANKKELSFGSQIHGEMDFIGHHGFRLEKMKNAKNSLENSWKAVNGNKNIPDDRQINFTDPESKIMVTKHHGVQQCYNLFALTDKKASIIVAPYASNSASESIALIPTLENYKQLNGSLENLVIVGDAGFFSAVNLEYAENHSFMLYTSFPQSSNPYHKEKFIYNEKEDNYTCPEGKILKPANHRPGTKTVTYQTDACLSCSAQKDCTNAKSGIRKVQRNHKEDKLREKGKEASKTLFGKEVLKERKSVVEPVFGNMVTNDNLDQMHYRGLNKVSKEYFLRCVVHNLRKVFKAFKGNKKARDLIMKGEQIFSKAS